MNQYRSHYQTTHRWEKPATIALAIALGLVYAWAIVVWCMA